MSEGVKARLQDGAGRVRQRARLSLQLHKITCCLRAATCAEQQMERQVLPVPQNKVDFLVRQKFRTYCKIASFLIVFFTVLLLQTKQQKCRLPLI